MTASISIAESLADVAPDRHIKVPRGASRYEAASVRVFTLGRLEVSVGDVPITRLRGRTSNLLQALVASGPRFVSQDRLAADIWDRSEGDAAIKALEVTVHRLRTLLGSRHAVEVSDRRIALDRAHVWVDAFALEEVFVAHEFALSDAARSEQLKTAIHLYRGDFLASEPTAPWLLPARERLRNRLVRMIEMNAGEAPSGHDTEWRIPMFRHAIGIDPVNEAFHCGLMQALAATGRMLEAMAVYARYERMALSWSGARPSDRMRAFAATLRERGRA